jgi:hypothetical protein
MKNVAVSIPENYDLRKAAKLIDRLCNEDGLVQRMKSTLKGSVGSTHWHYGRKSQNGTLEITLRPAESRILFSIHDNRRGPWTNETLDRLVTATRQALVSEKK